MIAVGGYVVARPGQVCAAASEHASVLRRTGTRISESLRPQFTMPLGDASRAWVLKAVAS